MSHRSGGRHSSTTELVDVTRIDGGWAELRDGRRRAALEVDAVNLILKGDAERDLVWRRYRRALSALAGSISLYTYSRPLPPPGASPGSSGPQAKADSAFARELLSRGTIHARRHLAVIWDDPAPGTLGALSAFRRAPRAPIDLERRRQALAASFEGAGLHCRPISDGTWLELLQEHTGGRSGRVPADFPSWLAPDSAVVEADQLVCPGRVCRSLVVQGYPRRLAVGWLAPVVLGPPCPLRLAQHLYPIPKLASLGHLRRRIRSFETGLEVDRRRGRRPDTGTRAALGDALALEERVLLEEERLFRMLTCITLEAATKEELDTAWHRLIASLAELGCTPVPLTNRQVDGWRATLPAGIDPLGWTRDMTAGAAATALPFLRAGLSTGSGVLLGPSPVSRELISVDLLAAANPNRNVVVLGTSGAGKSYTTKVLAARLAISGCRIRCLDPSGEYLELARLLGGSVVELGAAGTAGLNLLGPAAAGQDPARRASRAAGLVARALAARGIQLGPQPRELLGEVVEALLRADPAGASLAALVDRLRQAGLERPARQLESYLGGADSGIFDGAGPPPAGDVAVISLRHLQAGRDQLLGTAMELVLWHLEAELEARSALPTLLVVDEAEILLSSESSAHFLEAMARRIRKLGAGLLVVSQVVEDFLGSTVGNVIIRNCHTKLLLRQEPVAIPSLRRAFSLSPAECELLQGVEAGSGLVLVGEERAAFRGAAPPAWQRALLTGHLAGPGQP